MFAGVGVSFGRLGVGCVGGGGDSDSRGGCGYNIWAITIIVALRM